MQYKYKVARRIIRSSYQLKRVTKELFVDEDPFNKDAMEFLLPDFTLEKREQMYKFLDDVIFAGYATLNNPIRFKK